MNKYELHLGDCLEVMKGMPDNCVDSIVTDPPYGLGFMGKEWDHGVPSADVWAECLRVLKPGGHLLAFAGTRTQHRMACNIEDAGFEIRDMIAWVYGSGFPKSHNLKDEWDGWGTALKPSLEPITMARKPFKGTVAANVMAHGVGALNIDECRVGTEGSRTNSSKPRAERNGFVKGFVDGTETVIRSQGRWPANLIHDGSDEVLPLFPDNAGAVARVRGTEPSEASSGAVTGKRERVPGVFHSDSGSAARFFYCPKASRKDRHEGMTEPGPQFKHGATLRKVENTETIGNNHPTVKPTDLMAYLCRLVTPAGGIVLDPFMGSGSTGKAAMREGFHFIGIEMEPEYLRIAERRISWEKCRKVTGTQPSPDTKSDGRQ